MATREYDNRALQMAEMVGRRHKYNLKKDRWYVLIDYVGSDALIDAALPLWEKWEQSDEMEEAVKDLDQVLKTSFTPSDKSSS